MTTKRKDSASAWVDPDDAPILTDEFFEHGTWRIGEQEVTREEAQAAIAKSRGRPKSDETKVPVKIRLDPDLLAVLRATGPGWQTRVNRILRERFAM
ncbi:BrnA antitoxin family protein [Azotobacter beijerinckii]|uniref:Uncharacterized conserved protein, DUF4415 family n=1 Tax=Azotobacter beijerinckii TaxID=170623 RepID=A0A1I4GNA3_9GAMM|nr:BrnA antitoxin family protein [Azotobacter beijerinckii]SFB64263.1 Uncharacterized conserved protein, DUF4415 family [Azotobacter beijerinckii]SFL30960.1 Uncharacterized conserved protein, DUF4415 family [Azotobacter beijerinckii]